MFTKKKLALASGAFGHRRQVDEAIRSDRQLVIELASQAEPPLPDIGKAQITWTDSRDHYHVIFAELFFS